MAHYSSLFTLGLLSDRASPPTSPKSNIFYTFRKSSLPTSALSKPSDISLSPEVLHAPPQFTNPFADSPNATTELRSFLSLDLAADKASVARRSTKSLSLLNTNVPGGPPHSANPPIQQPLSSSTRHLPMLTPTDSLLPVRRPSRDSIRTIPSPRPAPSSALPKVPSNREGPHPIPPPIIIPNPSLFPFASSSSPTRSVGGASPTSCRPPLSAPPTIPASPSTASSFFAPIVSPRSLSSSRSSRNVSTSFMSFSSTSTSICTARRRKVERSNALACLEGRSHTPGRIRRSIRHRNFMSMTDDEDEDQDEEEDIDDGGDADVEDDGDLPEPLCRPSSRSSLPRPIAAMSNVSRSPVDEEEDCVLPASAMPQIPSSKSRSRSRRSTLESWFPIANFIDLKDDELQSWHGVVEIMNGL